MTVDLLFYVIATLLVVAGLAGTMLPVLPGTLLVFAGLFLAAWTGGFARVGAMGLFIIAVLALLSVAVDFLGSLAGARRVGASPMALAGAGAGAVLGIFLGIPGLVLGPFVGAVAGELLARRGWKQAGRVGLGTWLGLALAAVSKLVLAFLMIAVFAAFYAFSG